MQLLKHTCNDCRKEWWSYHEATLCPMCEHTDIDIQKDESVPAETVIGLQKCAVADGSYAVNIFLPAGAMGANEFDEALDKVLREIAIKHQKEGEWAEKYGTDIDNEVFMMHHFCWCEKEDCAWCGEIGAMPQLLREITQAKYNESKRAPNFWYKPLDFKVWWYKYIGRGVETNKILTEEQLKEMREKCLST